MSRETKTQRQKIDDVLDEYFNKTGKNLLGLVLFFPMLCFTGFIDVLVWRWFVMPVAPVGALTVPMALGLTLTFGTLTGRLYRESTNSASGAATFLFSALTGGVILNVAWLIHLWAQP